MAVDFKSLGKFEQGALIAGVVAIILSFIGSYVWCPSTAARTSPAESERDQRVGQLRDARDVLLVVAATAIVAVKAFAKENLPDGVPWSLVALAAAGLGTLLLIIRRIHRRRRRTRQRRRRPGWSGWLLFIATIALTVFTFLSFKESGEKMPEINKKNDTPPAPPAA